MNPYITNEGQYNLSYIMKMAWGFFRRDEGITSFSNCLKYYWSIARQIKEAFDMKKEALEIAKTETGRLLLDWRDLAIQLEYSTSSLYSSQYKDLVSREQEAKIKYETALALENSREAA